MTLTTRKMSSRHEADLAQVLGGRVTRNSGSVWVDTADGKHDGSQAFSFAWDGKATLGKSISVTRAMVAKVRDQAGPHIPMIPLRWYRDEALVQVDIDLVAVPLSVFAEMLTLANKMARIEQGAVDG